MKKSPHSKSGRRPVRRPIDELLKIMARLRGAHGCPWDREQTLKSLKPYVIEEAYEVLDAIDGGNPDKHAEELGDLLLQIVFHAQLRREQRQFDFDDVVRVLIAKLIHRHPHVFGKTRVRDSQDVLRNWEKLKALEKKPGENKSILAGLPRHLPALQRAQRAQSRAARVGFDWKRVKDVVAKIDEELAEVKQAMRRGRKDDIAEELGDLLFAVVNLCRFQHLHAEEVLDDNVKKFIGRFQQVEERVRDSGRSMDSCSLAELDRIWNDVKLDMRKQRRRGGKSHD